MSVTLFGRGLRPRWAGTRALAVRVPTCPICLLPTETFVAGVQLPLFYAAGYGEATRRTFRVCGCGWARLARVEAVNPR